MEVAEGLSVVGSEDYGNEAAEKSGIREPGCNDSRRASGAHARQVRTDRTESELIREAA